ncbi:MAG: ampD [Noviherbaspirillum sp.]|nr:ampD [Noviherbaspirillum sp.]
MNRTPPNSFRVGDDGWCAGVVREPSPNFDARSPEAQIRLLVVHNISLPPCQFGGPYIADLFANRLDCDAHPYFAQLRGVRVSAHFLVRRDGVVVQFVSANDRAWHAGVSSFRGQEKCNDFSIGIELEGSDFEPFEPVQYRRLAGLTRALAAHYSLTDVTGHQHIAPGRKTDPGPFFDWPLYRRMLEQRASGALGFPA